MGTVNDSSMFIVNRVSGNRTPPLVEKTLLHAHPSIVAFTRRRLSLDPSGRDQIAFMTRPA